MDIFRFRRSASSSRWSWWTPVATAVVTALWATPAHAAEPASCLSPNPSGWPAASKPYFMLLVDTSGSMISQVPPAPAAAAQPSCGYPANRMGHARCAVKNTVLAFGGEVSFGLAQFATFMTGCGQTCYGNASNNPNPGCDLQCFNAEIASLGSCFGCGAYDDVNDPTTAHGANVLVGMQVDNFWSTPPSATNIAQILSYVDNTCTSNTEVTSIPSDGPAYGLTPLNGSLRDMKRYFQTGWSNPDNPAITFPTPLDPNDRGCRSVNVILLTDGDETCDTSADAVAAAASLYNQGVTIGANVFKIRTHVINFAGGNKLNTDAIAAAGGTVASYFATNEVQLSQALANIVSGSIKPETCDNLDNNCNGCTDEGFLHYCDVQPVSGQCCTLARATCLTNYQASITSQNPKGDTTLLPCTTQAQSLLPAAWLCFDPGEKCDDVDNNCQAGVDDGVLKCGSPLHCPVAETCNAQDDDCDGLIDELVCINSCIPSPEICDGCDNDCDGIADDGVPSIPCGFAPPANCAGQLVCKPSQAVPVGGCAPGGGYNTCNNSPQAEICDALDNDCDGTVDDNVAGTTCTPAGTPAGLVYTGASQCKKGLKPCNGTCQGFVGPSAEVCDGVDNDCDGQVDEGALGVGQPCGVNQPPCTPGTTACIGGNLVCQGGSQPKPEICDGTDNDCDGQVDELPLTDAPLAGQNGCWGLPGNCCSFKNLSWCPPPGGTCGGPGALTPPCNNGTLACSGAAGWICQGPKGPSPEACDGKDNDCNGQVDDGNILQVGKACGSDVGECSEGILACNVGVLDCVGDVPPSPEVCDGKDNDCDQQIDNGIPTGGACTMAYDKSLYPGDRTSLPCQPGVLECDAMGGTICAGGVGPNPELCDGIDNDCDGFVDEVGPAPDGLDGSENPFPPPVASIGSACGSGVGECKEGAYACVNGLFQCLGSQAAGPEECDCADNDCDGQVDNPNAPGGPALCGAGKDCVKSANGACQCAAACGSEFPCPPGQKCENVLSSQTGLPLGPRCVVDPCQPNPCADGSCCDPVTGACGSCLCDGIVCPQGQTCVAGVCGDYGSTTGSGGAGSSGTDAGAGLGSGTGTGAGADDTASNGSGPAAAGFWGLTTGGGGCACDLSASRSAGGGVWLAIVGAVAALARRRSGSARKARTVSAAVVVSLALGSAGCTSAPFCFGPCDETTTGGFVTQTGAGGDDTMFGTGGEGGLFIGTTGSGCEQTNGGNEICDGVDNDCNGVTDDGPDIDFGSPKTCGNCATNCYVSLSNNDPVTITCDPGPSPGEAPGVCHGSCAQDYVDLDGDGLCEYYCVKSAQDDSLCNYKDDDCDNVKDEDVDLCTSTENCGKCGGNCAVVHGTPTCVSAGGPPCDTSTSHCALAACDCQGPGDCWWDLDGSYATGCEYACDLTNGGVEICGDGLDNDCDGRIDGADDLSLDPKVGVTCYGDPDGECKTAAHAGVSECVGSKIVCTGAAVLVANQVLETCNGKDDDCDGLVDDDPVDAGGACGTNNIFPCSFGALACQNGALVCVGAVKPGTETCNGQDDNCDGAIDKTGNAPPADSIGPCKVPTPPPAGATSPCKAGAKACVGGTPQCVGFVGPTSATDTCGVDANCDGALTNQPNKQTDVANCGVCGKNCLAGAVQATWACVSGACQFQGCNAGYYDLNNDGKCEYACTFVSAQEACNGLDDNCNGQIDEGAIAPAPAQVCGVNPSASSPECTSGVVVACQAGAWKCTFPAGVCNPSCNAASEVCDALDNDCNGLVNENVANYGQPCASDDGKPPPGDGACRTIGSVVCNGPSATKCSATKASCASLAGGCTELCDGVDNDCDGSVDEPFTAKGTNAANYVKPAVTKTAASVWTMSYEASRPTATTTTPGTGNGYSCTSYSDPGCSDNTVPLAPAGVTLDKTPACSVAGKIPWFNATPVEAEQTCKAAGGKLCSTSEWQTACTATVACKWGYGPRGAACTSSYVANTKLCNLGPTYDFNSNATGDQDGLLVTASSALKSCSADWTALLGNVQWPKIYDMTGNLREITRSAPNTYPLMGGSFNTVDENGATCSFAFYTVDKSFQLFDLGFRCCFTADPT